MAVSSVKVSTPDEEHHAERRDLRCQSFDFLAMAGSVKDPEFPDLHCSSFMDVDAQRDGAPPPVIECPSFDDSLTGGTAPEQRADASSADEDASGGRKKKRSSNKRKASTMIRDAGEEDRIKERNREHARLTRQRKKEYVIALEQQVSQLLARSEHCSTVAAMSSNDSEAHQFNRQQTSLAMFFDLRSQGITSVDLWAKVVTPEATFTQPMVPGVWCSQAAGASATQQTLSGLEEIAQDGTSMKKFLSMIRDCVAATPSADVRRSSENLRLIFEASELMFAVDGTKALGSWQLRIIGTEPTPKEDESPPQLRGMLKATFNQDGLIESLNLLFDPKALMTQLWSQQLLPVMPGMGMGLGMPTLPTAAASVATAHTDGGASTAHGKASNIDGVMRATASAALSTVGDGSSNDSDGGNGAVCAADATSSSGGASASNKSGMGGLLFDPTMGGRQPNMMMPAMMPGLFPWMGMAGKTPMMPWMGMMMTPQAMMPGVVPQPLAGRGQQAMWPNLANRMPKGTLPGGQAGPKAAATTAPSSNGQAVGASPAPAAPEGATASPAPLASAETPQLPPSSGSADCTGVATAAAPSVDS